MLRRIRTRYDRSRFPAPAKKAIDLEGRIVKDGVRKVVKDRQLALAAQVPLKSGLSD